MGGEWFVVTYARYARYFGRGVFTMIYGPLPNPPEYESPYADQFLNNIAELRHLYKNLVREDKEELARGLLGPRIEFFMSYWEENISKERTTTSADRAKAHYKLLRHHYKQNKKLERIDKWRMRQQREQWHVLMERLAQEEYENEHQVGPS